jgi:IPT/TIG domain
MLSLIRKTSCPGSRDEGKRQTADQNSGIVRARCTPIFLALTFSVLLAFAGCGGGGSSPSGSFGGTNNPVPSLTSISPNTTAAGGGAFTLTVNGSNFVSGSRVRWNGSLRTTTFQTSTRLTATITSADISSTGTASVTIFNPTPGGGTSSAVTFTITAALPLAITTTSLPASANGKNYYFALAKSGGVPPLTWSLASGGGNLPSGLTINPSTGLISGPISGIGTSNFTVRLMDSANPANTATQPLSIAVASTLGRNDNVLDKVTACPTGTDIATPISNGTIRASISPNGDVDTYTFTLSQAVSSLTLETFAARLDLDNNAGTQDSYLDTVLELLNSSCQVVALSDDISFTPNHVLDSKIRIGSTPLPTSNVNDPNYNQDDIPAPASLPADTYYIRVRDYRGDGRPEFIYDLTLTGVK